jgi:hypothetical protein
MRPPSRRAVHRHVPADFATTLTHPEDAEGVRVRPQWVESDAVVVYVQQKFLPLTTQRDTHLGRVRVAHHVVERRLEDPEDDGGDRIADDHAIEVKIEIDGRSAGTLYSLRERFDCGFEA